MNTSTPAPRIAPWHWSLPFAVLALTAPLWLKWWEPTLFRTLNGHFGVLPDLFWSTLSLLGTAWAVYALTAPALWRAPRLLLAWICAAPAAGLLATPLKKLFESNRPLEALGPEGLNLVGDPLFIGSMPSGHTLTAFAGATAIYFSLSPEHRSRWLWLFVVAFGVACSRVAVGAHWPADTAVGAAMGILAGLVGAWLAGKIPERQLRPQSWLMRAVALLGVYTVYFLCTDEMGFDINLPAQYLLAAFMSVCLVIFVRKSLRAA